MALHTGYRLFLVKAYEAGDLAQTYPLARGTAPLLTTLGGILLIREIPTPLAIAGITLLSAGTLLMSMRGGDGLTVERRAVRFALVTSLFVAGYTLTDGVGARAAEAATSYAAWLFLADAIATMALMLFHARPRRSSPPCCRNGGPGWSPACSRRVPTGSPCGR